MTFDEIQIGDRIGIKDDTKAIVIAKSREIYISGRWIDNAVVLDENEPSTPGRIVVLTVQDLVKNGNKIWEKGGTAQKPKTECKCDILILMRSGCQCNSFVPSSN